MLIEKTEAFLKERFDGSGYLNAHPAAKAYRLEHTYRVANLGREIARREAGEKVWRMTFPPVFPTLILPSL